MGAGLEWCISHAAFVRRRAGTPLYIAPLSDDPELPVKVDEPTAGQRADLEHRYSLEDPNGKLDDMQAFMANLIVYRRHTATLPHGVDIGSEVLFKQALCEVLKIDCTIVHTHGRDGAQRGADARRGL